MTEKKLVPKRRFKEFNYEWSVKKFRELSEIVRGASPRPIQDPKWFDENSDVGWLRISDVTKQNGRIKYLEQRLSVLGERGTRVLKEPHLLLSIAATVGKPVVNYVKTGVHDGFLIFLDPKFDREYMYQWLEMYRPNWSKYGQPGSQVNLNSEIVKEQNIILPSKIEQQKIGEFFNQLDEMIALQQKKIDKTKALKSAYLAEMFPAEGERVPKRRFAGFTEEWKEQKLGDFAEVIGTGDSTFITKTKETNENPYAVLGSTSVIGYDSDYDYNGKFILTARVGANAGNIYKYSGKVKISDNTVFIKSNNLEFLFYLLEKHNLKNLSFGTGQPLIKASELNNLILKIPNKKEQQSIGEFFKKLDDTIMNHQQKLDKLKATKQAYLNEMFV